jgi:FkbM family methyltransferase
LALALVPLGTAAARLRWLDGAVRAIRGRTVVLRPRSVAVSITAPLTDAWPVFEVFGLNEYDFEQTFATNPRWIVDCGAHVGSFSIWIASQLDCIVYALEPNPSILPLLRSNIAPFGGRIRVQQAAIAGVAGTRKLFDAGFPGGSSLLPSARVGQSYDVRCMTLEQVLTDTGFPTIDLLKVDIEGAETELFKSASLTTLRSIRSTIIECHPWLGTDTDAIVAHLERAGMIAVRTGDDRIVRAWRE